MYGLLAHQYPRLFFKQNKVKSFIFSQRCSRCRYNGKRYTAGDPRDTFGEIGGFKESHKDIQGGLKTVFKN